MSDAERTAKSDRRRLIEQVRLALAHQTVPVFHIGRVGEVIPAEQHRAADRLKWFAEYWARERMREQRP